MRVELQGTRDGQRIATTQNLEHEASVYKSIIMVIMVDVRGVHHQSLSTPSV